jgi:putative colanic acid biosynthesis acetyltransferase WcaF
MNSPSEINVDLPSYSRGDFDPGPWIRRAIWYVISLMFIESALPWPTSLKHLILRSFGTRLGKLVVLKPRLRIKFPWNLSVGDHSWLGEEVWIDNLAPVHIGNNVCLSQGACVMTGNHDRKSRSFDLRLSPVDIADGAWIGARSLICPGTQAERHAVVEAGAVAKGTLEEAGIYAGNPAVRIGTRCIS